MKCYYHNHKEAVTQCENCRQGLCPECAVAKTNLCLDCLLNWDKKIKKIIFEKTTNLISFWLIIFISFSFILQSNISIIFKLTCLVSFWLKALPSGWKIIINIRDYLLFELIEYEKYETPSNLIIIIGFLLKPLLCAIIAPLALLYEIIKTIKNILYIYKVRNTLKKGVPKSKEIEQGNPI